jgi:hypothetical protein
VHAVSDRERPVSSFDEFEVVVVVACYPMAWKLLIPASVSSDVSEDEEDSSPGLRNMDIAKCNDGQPAIDR